MDQDGLRYGSSVVTCYNCNNLRHTARCYKFNGFVNYRRVPNVRRNNYNGRRNNGSNRVNYENINNTFVNISKYGNEKVWILESKEPE